MTQDGFDWNAYFSRVSFREVQQNAPDLAGRRDPSCLSPDRKWILCSSVDLDASTRDAVTMRVILADVVEAHRMAEVDDYRTKFLTKVDCVMLCRCLEELTGDSEFADPEEYLQRALEAG